MVAITWDLPTIAALWAMAMVTFCFVAPMIFLFLLNRKKDQK